MIRVLFKYSPIWIFALFIPPYIFTQTRHLFIWILGENHPIELATSAIFILGGIKGCYFVYKHKSKILKRREFFLLGGFSLGLIFIGMEEIAWGQHILGFTAPEFWRNINVQNELTIHNLKGLQANSEFLRFTFGATGLLVYKLGKKGIYNGLSVPPYLLPLLCLVTLHASIDIYNDFWKIERYFDYFIQRTSELIELYIASASYLFLHYNRKNIVSKFSNGPDADVSTG